MNITIFAKKRKTADGRVFYSFISRLVNKTTGEEETFRVKFRDECGSPKADDCPCVIEVERGKINRVVEHYVDDKTGDDRTSQTLWISEWTKGGEYVDTSMDDYE